MAPSSGPAPDPAISTPDPLGADPLLGSWSATRWLYIARQGGRKVDLVCDLGGRVTLSLSPGAWILSWEIDGQGGRSVGGSFAQAGDRLHLRRHAADLEESLLCRQAGSTLALSSLDSAWDFGTGGEVAAEFVAVLVRL